jgi:hypothetical protein
VPLVHGDVVVWEGHHPLMGGHRINLAFRKAA